MRPTIPRRFSGPFPVLRPRLAALLLAALLLASGCAPRVSPPGTVIADLRDMPQDAAAYIDPLTATRPLLPAAVQRELADDYRQRFFSPWRRTVPAHGPQEVFKLLDGFDPARYHGENRLPLTDGFAREMRGLADPDSFPNTMRPAISVANSDLRVLPTVRPLFYNFDLAGEGFPFDYNQNSAVWAQTPLLVLHTSADGAWALVETSTAAGWMPTRDLALVDAGFMDAFNTVHLAALTADRVPVVDCYGQFRFMGRVGMVLPMTGREAGTLDVLIAARDASGRALLLTAGLGEDVAAPWPLAPTPASFARLANEMLGQPYGWGGLYRNRDCSALVMDLFAPLGIWQPRNSGAQARHWGLAPLGDLDREARLRVIAAEARPWLTLFWRPGHIALYIGQWQGRPAVLHAAWGVRTRVGKAEGRHILGATVITSLEPGQDLPELERPGGVLLLQLGGMAQVAR
ncbi:SH3 domain-containing protein [Desulfocurvus sp.]|jgi:hypothetical protein|uniref:SH3 domain-containing protein n=1 Tax=Desulfocurvus sp. TaxID=2871698 RepID=UPI0025C66DC2|nr:SH3 domain-containing protein [Desulfocurvus sp.]MCK9239820.1 SH3 domain-containing protein [Desulfocurvus sp.]